MGGNCGERVLRVKSTGLPREQLSKLRAQYPSIRPIREFCSNGEIRGFSVRVPRRGNTFYNLVVLCDDLLGAVPSAYVVDDIEGHYHLWKKMRIPGTNARALWVCDASYHGKLRLLMASSNNEPAERIGYFLSHVVQILNCSEDIGVCGCHR